MLSTVTRLTESRPAISFQMPNVNPNPRSRAALIVSPVNFDADSGSSIGGLLKSTSEHKVILSPGVPSQSLSSGSMVAEPKILLRPDIAAGALQGTLGVPAWAGDHGSSPG